MYGYIFETTNNKTGKKYLGKRLAVTFDKNYLGDDEELSKDVEKYGRVVFTVKMLRPFESAVELDKTFAKMLKERKPEAPKQTASIVDDNGETKKSRKKKSEVVDE